MMKICIPRDVSSWRRGDEFEKDCGRKKAKLPKNGFLKEKKVLGRGLKPRGSLSPFWGHERGKPDGVP